MARRTGAPPWLAAAIAALLTANIAAASVVAFGPVTVRASHHSTTHGRVVPTSPAARELEQRADAIRALLTRQGNAIVRHDRAAYLATIDPLSIGFRGRAARVFDNFSRVPFASWSYDVDPFAQRAITPALRARYGNAPVWAPGVVLHYRLAGFDSQPTEFPDYLTFVERGTQWYVANDGDFASGGLRNATQLWDSGPVVVARGSYALILGHAASGALLDNLRDEADRDVPSVTTIWGRDWAQRVVILVPASQHELSSLLGGGGDLDQIAAVATAEISGTPGQVSPIGDRIAINPRNFRKLGPLGRRVVITHEITHVASRRYTGPDSPTWLIEGLADYVGYSGTGVPVGVAAQELATEVRAGHVPSGLPLDVDFGGGNRRLPQIYEESWLACRLIASRVQASGLVRLYRLIGTMNNISEAAAVANGIDTVLHMSVTSFEAAWRTYLRQELT